MKRFLVRLAPLPLLVYPLWSFSDHFEGLDRSLEWRQHTYEARSLAERLARDVGCPPTVGRLRDDLAKFAAMTDDNPAQVAIVAEIRRNLDPPDLARLAALTEAAIEEENRLLPARAVAAREKVAETKRSAVFAFLLGCAVFVIQAFGEFFVRATAPTDRHAPPPATPPVPPVGRRPGGGR